MRCVIESAAPDSITQGLTTRLLKLRLTVHS